MAANPHDLIDGASSEALAGAAFFVGTVFVTIISYFMKKPPPPPSDSTVVGVGFELGNRHQMEMLVSEQKRCADYLSVISSHLSVLADRKQEAIEDKLDTLLERLGEKERRT